MATTELFEAGTDDDSASSAALPPASPAPLPSSAASAPASPPLAELPLSGLEFTGCKAVRVTLMKYSIISAR